MIVEATKLYYFCIFNFITVVSYFITDVFNYNS